MDSDVIILSVVGAGIVIGCIAKLWNTYLDGRVRIASLEDHVNKLETKVCGLQEIIGDSRREAADDLRAHEDVVIAEAREIVKKRGASDIHIELS